MKKPVKKLAKAQPGGPMLKDTTYNKSSYTDSIQIPTRPKSNVGSNIQKRNIPVPKTSKDTTNSSTPQIRKKGGSISKAMYGKSMMKKGGMMKSKKK